MNKIKNNAYVLWSVCPHRHSDKCPHRHSDKCLEGTADSQLCRGGTKAVYAAVTSQTPEIKTVLLRSEETKLKIPSSQASEKVIMRVFQASLQLIRTK